MRISPTTLLSIIVLISSHALAVSVILPAIADTSLYENHPDSNLGGTTLVSGTNQVYSKSRALFKFDIGAIPAGALITDVSVALNVTRRPDPDQHTGPQDSGFGLYKVLVDWGQGTGDGVTGSTAIAGDATWNDRHFGNAAWTAPGGQIGTDYANNPSATTLVSSLGDYTWGSSPELVSDIQSWLASPSSNFGFVVISDGENSPGTARRFASIEQPGGLIPGPRLTISYTLVAAPEPSVTALMVMFTGFSLFKRRR